ncbi:MAG: hypothetical protein CM1200mP27_07880 [Chloroflexota bacterium]|nr:MAG: hypothetical protein CM1200mP27_07880 [Chloroflexota bacterium]
MVRAFDDAQGSEEPGFGTDIQAVGSTQKVIPMDILFLKSYYRNGTGKNITQVSREKERYLNYVAINSTCVKIFGLTPGLFATFDEADSRWEMG